MHAESLDPSRAAGMCAIGLRVCARLMCMDDAAATTPGAASARMLSKIPALAAVQRVFLVENALDHVDMVAVELADLHEEDCANVVADGRCGMRPRRGCRW